MRCSFKKQQDIKRQKNFLLWLKLRFLLTTRTMLIASMPCVLPIEPAMEFSKFLDEKKLLIIQRNQKYKSLSNRVEEYNARFNVRHLYVLCIITSLTKNPIFCLTSLYCIQNHIEENRDIRVASMSTQWTAATICLSRHDLGGLLCVVGFQMFGTQPSRQTSGNERGTEQNHHHIKRKTKHKNCSAKTKML